VMHNIVIKTWRTEVQEISVCLRHDLNIFYRLTIYGTQRSGSIRYNLEMKLILKSEKIIITLCLNNKDENTKMKTIGYIFV